MYALTPELSARRAFPEEMTRGAHPGATNRTSSDKLSKPVSRSRIGSSRRWESKRRRSSIGARNWIHTRAKVSRGFVSSRGKRERERERAIERGEKRARIFRDGAYSLFYTFMTRTFMHSLLRSRKTTSYPTGKKKRIYRRGRRGEVGWR